MVWPFTERRRECEFAGTCIEYEEYDCTSTPKKRNPKTKKPECYRTDNPPVSASPAHERRRFLDDFFNLD